ncbi:LytR/AlgR family response regulator transcription factor [Pengzhenrongella frigida]|uniref:LytR/AlgR family response regulator transcription factor n=1 Tax=Pengzhenrongella frigida TaxID=1259133 RepID=UPI001F5CC78B|nr:LytTR family DNA-binding domain-containing protein [Cellulomonas sp. HLT2-17]
MPHVIRVGVVEDDPAATAQILAYLHRFETEHDVTFAVQTYPDGRDVVERYQSGFDIIFLDVEMPYIDGFEAARHIRTLDSEVVLVFITNMAQYAIKGYQVDALSYLLKPVPYFAFSQELRRSIDKTRSTQGDWIMLSVGSGMARVYLSDITYIESIRHKIIVHGVDRTYVPTGTLKAFESQLADKGFFRSNNCYLVNLRHVTGVDATSCVMIDGADLQVSRPRRRAFLQALADHVGGRTP